MSAFPHNGGGYPIGIRNAPPNYPFPEASNSTGDGPISPGYPAQRPPGFSPASSVELPSYSNPSSPQTATAPQYTYPQPEPFSQDTQGGTMPVVGYPGPPPTGPPPVYPGSPSSDLPQMPGEASASSACATQVELSIRCANLVDRDVLSKSDPMVIILMSFGGRWVEKGRTENIRNCLNPEFSRRIRLDYFFEETQQLRFEVYDIDNTTTTLSDDDFLGTMECTLGQIVTSSPLTKPLLQRNGNKMGNGSITVDADEVENVGNREVIQFNFKAEGLDNKDFIGKSDPFLEFFRKKKFSDDGVWQMVHRTETIKNNLNPVWKPFEIRQQHIGGSNLDTNILIKCYDEDKDGSHDFIGECQMTLKDFLDAQNQPKAWPCINDKKQQKKGKNYKDSGTLILTSVRVTKSHSFLDYIFGGLQINFTVAIDFTASNGDPQTRNSLHYIHRSHPNEYTSAIYAVGGVVQDYDSDKLFPALGFGAKIPPHYVVSHEFALNFNMANPFCSGIQGLVEAYHSCLMQVQLYGPTNFAPVINHVARFAEHAHMRPTPENYFILLILTDGVVTDMPATCRAIVRASYLPMSIIIVGVGKNDFSNMNFLDDGGALKSPNGTQALRDIVQFVPYYKFKTVDTSFLAKEVLAEVPQQLTEYYRLRNIPPKRPIPQIVIPT